MLEFNASLSTVVEINEKSRLDAIYPIESSSGNAQNGLSSPTPPGRRPDVEFKDAMTNHKLVHARMTAIGSPHRRG